MNDEFLRTHSHIVMLGLFAAFLIIEIIMSRVEGTDPYVLILEDMIAWALIAVFSLFVMMLTPAYGNIIINKGDRIEWITLSIFFGIICSFGTISGLVDDNTLIFKFGFLGALLGCVVGGPKMGFMAATIGSSLRMVSSIGTIIANPINNIDAIGPALSGGIEDCILSCIFMFIAAFIGSILCYDQKKKYSMKFLCIVSTAICIVGAGIMFILTAAFSEYFTSYTIREWIFCIFMPAEIVGVVGMIAYVEFRKVIDQRVDLIKTKNDLSVAKKIQSSAIPTEFPIMKTMKFFGSMEPAIDVGGDFYDVFAVKDGVLAIVIADVSDKGLPAALFMMEAKATIKSIAMADKTPEEILKLSNIQLCQGNGTGQFVTAWVGLLDTDMDILWFSNAGHTAPYFKKGNGSFEKLEMKKGLMLGYSEKAKFKLERLGLGDGDTLFLYTDGVNEAFNKNNEEFGHERLNDVLNASKNKEPMDIISSVRESVRLFTGDAPTSDDITMFCITMDLSKVRRFVTISDEEKLDEVKDFVRKSISEVFDDEHFINKMEIVAEEIFINICQNAYEEKIGEVIVQCRLSDDEIKLSFLDGGIPFNPLDKEEPDLDKDIKDWPIGGLGIHMIRKMVDKANYKFIDGKNIFTVRKNIK